MFERARPVRDPVSLTFDGRTIQAERGEPIAVALLAAGERTFARSPKLHRPRGPSCLRGDCDGCLARLDGVPNAMLCTHDAHGGESIEAQNVLGTRELDLLRVTDWFFPNGIDHHHLLAGVPGASDLMQSFARQMAGIGRLPDGALAAEPAERRDVDVLVVGGGLAGLACAAELARRGLRVEVRDEAEALGGSARFASDEARAAVSEELVALDGSHLVARSTVAAIERDVALAVPTPAAACARAAAVRFRAIVLATGTHDGAIAVPGNDLPGVMSARAVCSLAWRGVVPTDGVFVVGAGAWGDRLARALGDRVRGRADASEVEAIVGTSRVKAIRLRGGDEVRVGVVAIATSPAPTFELAVQAGASTRRTEGGFAVAVDAVGRAAPGVYAVGGCAAIEEAPSARVAQARATAAAIVEDLAASNVALDR